MAARLGRSASAALANGRSACRPRNWPSRMRTARRPTRCASGIPPNSARPNRRPGCAGSGAVRGGDGGGRGAPRGRRHPGVLPPGAAAEAHARWSRPTRTCKRRWMSRAWRPGYERTKYGPGRWAPLFSSPDAELAHTAMCLPAAEREAFIASVRAAAEAAEAEPGRTSRSRTGPDAPARLRCDRRRIPPLEREAYPPRQGQAEAQADVFEPAAGELERDVVLAERGADHPGRLPAGRRGAEGVPGPGRTRGGTVTAPRGPPGLRPGPARRSPRPGPLAAGPGPGRWADPRPGPAPRTLVRGDR